MRVSVLFVSVFALFFVTACNEDRSYSGGEYEVSRVASADFASAPMAESAPPSQMALDRSKFNNRRIAETHNMIVELEPDQLKPRYDRDFRQCLELGCEITSSNAQSRRSGYINARISPDKLGAYLDFLGSGPGELKEHSVNADDKTLQYIDTEAKIKNLERLRDRLITLLNSEKTEKVSEVLQIERELNRVEQQLDSANGSLRHLATITGMATVNSRYNVPYQVFEISTYEFRNSLKRAQQAFLDNVSRAIRFVGAVLPWIPVWVIGFLVFVKTIKIAFKGFSLVFWKKKKNKNKSEDVKAKETKAKKS